MLFRNLFDRSASSETTKKQKKRSRKAKRSAFRKEMARGLRMEPLEDRRMLASYTWDGATTLDISLDTNENLEISEAGGNRAFTLSAGIFTQLGGVPATGDGSPTIFFGPGATFTTSLTIDNSGALAGTNDVTFDGGAIASGTITVNASQPGTTSQIDFATDETDLIGGAINLTSNGADITITQQIT